MPGHTPNLDRLGARHESGKQESYVRVVIAAESGRLRDRLRAMLDSVPALETVAVVDDRPSALEAIQSDPPDLVIPNAHLFNEATVGFVCAISQERSALPCGGGQACSLPADSERRG